MLKQWKARKAEIQALRLRHAYLQGHVDGTSEILDSVILDMRDSAFELDRRQLEYDEQAVQAYFQGAHFSLHSFAQYLESLALIAQRRKSAAHS